MRPLLVATLTLALFACPRPEAEVGPQGPAGERGAMGERGPEGARGAPGEAGLVGPAGPQGPAGVDGARGDVGPTGPTGPQGAQGPQGPAGPAGPQGLQGPAGAVLVIDGGVVTGPAGASVVVTPIAPGTAPCTTGGVRITQLSDGGISNVCNGAVGPIGLQGIAGPQGPVGATGASISASALSPLSPQCPTGGVLVWLPDGGALPVCNGSTGPTGPQGAMGPMGLTGATGAAGPMGSPGPQGAIGPMGPAGPTGPVGPMGSVGPQGPSGPAGAPGMAGPAGPAGPVGATGAQGAAGPQGAPGPAGPPGATGPAGPAGPVGPALYLDGGLAFPNDTPTFAGFTSATYTGSLDGVVGANQKCHAEFPGSALCTIADFDRSNPLVAPTALGAWIDSDRATSGARNRSSCGGWTIGTTADYGTNLNATGVFVGQVYCNNIKPLACCRAPTSSVFRGFTSALRTGNLGGVIGANQLCHSEFPGSSLCTIADYDRANPLVAPGGTGAWIDSDRAVSGARSRSSCGNWTVGTTADYGTNLNQHGFFTGQVYCNASKPVACCQSR